METERKVIIMKDLSGYLKDSQIKKIYYAADKWRDKLLIRLLWKSGRRITEILNLKVKDIDFEEKRILWIILKKKIGKGEVVKSWKTIDIKTLELLAWFINQLELKPDYYVINAGNPFKPITRQRAFQIVRRAGKLAGIEKVGEKKIHPHHFRHSFAVNMAHKLKSPADMRKLQKHLEHSHLGMTETYLQFGDFGLGELIED